jgi:guanine deaminase
LLRQTLDEVDQAKGLPQQHWAGGIIMPGFVDMHGHYLQIDVISSSADGLLSLLEKNTFPKKNALQP